MKYLNFAFPFAVFDYILLTALGSYALSGDDLESKLESSNVEKQEIVSNDSSINYVNLESVHREFENKKVPVLMFHNFGEREDRYTISPDNFRKLLEELYVNDFYSVSLEEFHNGDFSNVPVGKKPVLFTFDDAGKGQFMLKNDSSVCDNSAVGVMEDFYNSYDFGRKGVKFVSYGTDKKFRLPFEQNDLASDKMKMLIDMGYDIADHTVFHENNTYASTNDIFTQHTISSALKQYLLGDYVDRIKVNAFAHPFGASPSSPSVFEYLSSKYDVVFDAWGGSSNHPLSQDFDAYKIPRIEITYHTRNLVLNAQDTYVVTPDTKKFYEISNGVAFKREKPLIKLKSFVINPLDNNKVSQPIVFY